MIRHLPDIAVIDTRLQRHSAYAFGAALLFGASAPASKLLLDHGVGVMCLSGLLYLGSGVGLLLFRALRLLRAGRTQGEASRESPLRARDAGWLAGAIVCGGVAAPALLFWGLAGTGATEASLLLATEGVLTVLISAVAFGEQVDRRVVIGAGLMLVASVLVSIGGPLAASASAAAGASVPAVTAVDRALHALAIIGACALWGVDNNLTRPISGADPVTIAMAKGLVAGLTSLVIAAGLGEVVPEGTTVVSAMALGSLAYGASLLLYILALRHLGSARTAAHFGTAPFIGAALSMLLLGEPVSAVLIGAFALMAVATWIALSERHEHEHRHVAGEHAHRHVHDAHHQHGHDGSEGPEPHAHGHSHQGLRHTHPHLPDLHHRHRH